MDIRDLSVCPECGANIKFGDFCLNCGYAIEEKKQEGVSDSSGIVAGGSIQAQPENHKKITSLFDRLVPEDFDLLSNKDSANENLISRHRSKLKLFLTPFLVIFLLFFFSANAYSLWIKKVAYVEPTKFAMDSSSSEIQNQIDKLQLTSNENIQKTLDFKTDLKDGNFDKTDFSVFADPNTNLLIEAFDFRHFLKNIINKESILTQIKKDLEMSDDDFDVYFSKEFAFIFPDANFDKWGVVLCYNDEKIIGAKLEKLKKIREASKKNFYTDYSVVAVTIKANKFILISNSKVYLDQMKEMAEGNVQNLAKDAVYVDAVKDLPKLGAMFVYKKENSSAWTFFIENVIAKYNTVQSLDVALKSIQSSAIVFSNDNDKTRITY